MHKINIPRRAPKARRRRRRGHTLPPFVVYLPYARSFAGGDEEQEDFFDFPLPCELEQATLLQPGWGMQFVCPLPDGGVLMTLPAARRMVRAGAYEAHMDYALKESRDEPQGAVSEDAEFEGDVEDALGPDETNGDPCYPSDEELQAWRRERRRKKRKALSRWRRRRAKAVAKKLKAKAG
jgi:hypothetical protein